MIIQGSPEILRGPRGLNGFGDFGAPESSVQDLFKAVLGREGDAGGVQYFVDRFGPSIEPGERVIFETMAKAEIQARDAEIARLQTTGSSADSAKAQNIALNVQIQQGAGEFALLLAAEPARLAAEEAASKKFWDDQTALINAQAAAAQAATAAANAAAATRQAIADAAAAAKAKAAAEAEAATKLRVAAALAAAKAAAEAEAEAKARREVGPSASAAQATAAALRKKAIDAVKALYLQVLGREGDAAGLDYFADRFGDVIDPSELQIFKGMAQPEIDARNAYLADLAKKSAEDAAKARAVADAFTAAQAAAAAVALAATAAEAASKKAIADAFAAAAAAKGSAALRERALVVVKALYLSVLGREGDEAGLDYFADRFGDVIDPDELQIFSDMSKPEIDARNAYLADMAKKSKEDAAKAKAIADQFAASAANTTVVNTTTTGGGGGGGINPMLILAVAAAAFFIGG
jgi:hypothetical protein